jgi:hypothetical protein
METMLKTILRAALVVPSASLPEFLVADVDELGLPESYRP